MAYAFAGSNPAAPITLKTPHLAGFFVSSFLLPAFRLTEPAPLSRLAELRRAHNTLGEGLRAGQTMDEVTVPHKGSLSEHSIGIVTAPGFRGGRLPKVSSD